MNSPRSMLLVLLAALLLAATMAPSSAAAPEVIRLPLDDGNRMYDRPVIGIVTHPGTGTRKPPKGTGSYIAASYVKFVESAGARAIPLIYDDKWEHISGNLSLVNGVLFTGGSRMCGRYKRRINKIFQHVMERNDRPDRDPIPLLAVCLGFELLTMNVSGKGIHILKKLDRTIKGPSTLQFPDRRLIKGSVFGSFEDELIEKVQSSRLAMQIHKHILLPETWEDEENPELRDFFHLLTTSKVPETGQEYISTIQAKRYPIIATQWHPEKAIFEWGQGYPDNKDDVVPHSEDAVRVTQHFANYFVSLARKSTNRRPDEDEVRRNVVDNYYSKFGASRTFDKVYTFPKLCKEPCEDDVKCGKKPSLILQE